MFEITSILGSTFTVLSLAIVLGVAFILGVALSLTYMFINRKTIISKGFALTMIVLPIVISAIILLVQDSWARAFSLAGTFAIIRFRTTQSNPKDLVLVFATLAIGLACGSGYILVGVILVVTLCVILIVLNLLHFGESRTPKMRLKVTIPEDLNYVGVFDEVMNKYTVTNQLVRVKSTNFGTMFDLTFDIVFKKDVNEKEFIDSLREVNGNLTVVLQSYAFDPELAE